MAMNLDLRQRAMLQEMGITLWLPKPAVPAAVSAAPASVLRAAAEVTVAEVQAPTAAPFAAAPAPRPLPAPMAPVAAPVPQAPAVVSSAPAEAAATAEWRMALPVQAYPAATGGSANDAWLVLWECPNSATPLVGDTGQLLHNMLRALRLHHSAHVWIASLQRPGSEALPVAGSPDASADWQDLAQALPASIERSQPARILALGLHTARAVLGSQDALGRLRAQVHAVQHIPTVVSYDPAYLLRSPHAKPAAWADLCRAHALRPPSAA